MDDLNIRLWCKEKFSETKCMLIVSPLQPPPKAWNVIAPPMGCVGFRDRKGLQIFEQDICIYGAIVFVVKFKDGGFGFDSIFHKGSFVGFAGHNQIEDIKKNISVIGNMHQNPELLKTAAWSI